MKRNPRFAAGAQSRSPGFNESGASKPGITGIAHRNGNYQIAAAKLFITMSKSRARCKFAHKIQIAEMVIREPNSRL